MWPNILLIIIIIVVYNIVKSKNAEKRKLTEARDELINDVLNEITRNAKNMSILLKSSVGGLILTR